MQTAGKGIWRHWCAAGGLAVAFGLLGAGAASAQPERITVPSGSRIRVDYSGERPVLAARLQELFGWKGIPAAIGATAITAGVPLVFVVLADSGAWRYFWTLFGTSNQLLASLSLMGITVWLKNSGRRYWYALVPMVFVTAVTASSLVLQIHSAFFKAGVNNVERINGVVAIVLFLLAGAVAWFCVRALLQKPGVQASTRLSID